MINILTYEDFQEEYGERASQSWYQDWLMESITFKYIMDKDIWVWSEYIDTGGYFEKYDVTRDFYGFFKKCTCNDGQFRHYIYDSVAEEKVKIECPHCFEKKMHEMSLQGIQDDIVWGGVQIDCDGKVRMTLANIE